MQKAIESTAKVYVRRAGFSEGDATASIYEGPSSLIMRAGAHSLLSRLGACGESGPEEVEARGRARAVLAMGV